MTNNHSQDPLLVKLATEALAHQSQGNQSMALIALKRIHRQFPNFADAWVSASVILFDAGRTEEALDMALRALGLDNENPHILHILANAYWRLGNIGEAAEYFEKTLERDPRCVPALISLAEIYVDTKRPNEALDMALRAVALDPENLDALCALAKAHERLGNVDEAIANVQKALSYDPKHIQALICLAKIYVNSNFVEALKLCDMAVEAQPSDAVLWAIRGYIKLRALDIAGTEADLKRALELDGDNIILRKNLAILQLLQHRYLEAWQCFKPKGDLQLGSWRDFGEPHWEGEQLNGRALLVYTEHHGFGDVIQFSRFFPQIRSQYGGRLLLLTYEPLKRLLSNLPGIDQIVVEGDPLPDFDLAVPLLELPAILNIDPLNLPPPPVQVVPEHRFVSALDRPGFKAGLVWAGNPIHSNDELRSMSPRFLDGLADMPGVAWYGLQKPTPVDPPGLPGFIDMSPYMSDFMDTAQIAKQLDLIVTVDTSMAHLAGSLGLPTVVLLSYLPEWRWGLDSRHTPWYPYPDFLLLRQPAHGDWLGVIQLLRGCIAEFMARYGYSATSL